MSCHTTGSQQGRAISRSSLPRSIVWSLGDWNDALQMDIDRRLPRQDTYASRCDHWALNAGEGWMPVICLNFSCGTDIAGGFHVISTTLSYL